MPSANRSVEFRLTLNRTNFGNKSNACGLLIVIIICPTKSIPRLANRISNGNCPLCLKDIMATDDMGTIKNPYDDA